MMKKKTITIALVFIALLAGVFWWFQHRSEPAGNISAYEQTVPVRVAAVVRVSVRDSLSVPGSAEAFTDVDVFAETSGLVRKAAAEVGARKKAGEILFMVDDELQLSSLKKAQIAYDKAVLDYSRYQALHHDGAVSASVLESVRLKREEAETDLIEARKRFRNTKITAPVTGTVASKLVDEGEMVQPGMKVANLVDISRLRVKFFLTEKNLQGIEQGYPLTVIAGSGVVLEGTLATLSGKAGNNRTYEAEAVLANSGSEPLRAGMFVRVILQGRELHDVQVIPRIALTGSLMNPEVYVVRDGKARLRKITPGREYGDRLEVTEGLTVGELVVTNGQNELRDGMPVRVIPQNRMETAQ